MAKSSVSAIRFCKKCQCDTQRYKSGACKVCTQASNAKWNANNRERMRAATVAWQAANPERVRSNNAAWKALNADRVKAVGAAYAAANVDRKRATNLAWRQANTDLVRAYARKWASENRQKCVENTTKWAAANPEAKRIIDQNRRARKRNVVGGLSKGLAAKLFMLQKGKCPCCKQPLGEKYHLDHITPLALGGAHIDDNIQLLRQHCNLQKHSKDPVAFMQERGYLL